jgi:hypothetical protein
MDRMAKRKKGDPDPKGDRHLSNTMVRLPEDLYVLLRDLAQENARPLTWEVRLAVTEHLRKSGKLPGG